MAMFAVGAGNCVYLSGGDTPLADAKALLKKYQ